MTVTPDMIEVPEALRYDSNVASSYNAAQAAAATLAWQANNPQVPTQKDLDDYAAANPRDELFWDFAVWFQQERMYRKPSMPPEVAALLCEPIAGCRDEFEYKATRSRYNADILRAVELGRKLQKEGR